MSKEKKDLFEPAVPDMPFSKLKHCELCKHAMTPCDEKPCKKCIHLNLEKCDD